MAAPYPHRQRCDCFGRRIRVRGEVLFDASMAVKSDYSNAMGNAANHCVEHCPRLL